jgi:glycosyltransferase involved in cell wall biosynthesis
MKIGILIYSLNVKGGGHRQALELANYLKNKGHKIIIFTYFFDKNSTHDFLIRSLNVEYLYNLTKEEELHFWGDIEKVSNKLLKFLLIIKNTFKKIRLAQKIAEKIPPDLDLLNTHDEISFIAGYYAKKKLKNLKTVFMCNDVPSYIWTYKRFERKMNLIKKIFLFILDKINLFYLKSYDKIVVLDNLNKEALKTYFNLEGEIIKSGLALDGYVFNSDKKINKNEIKILTVGFLERHKRFEDAILALKILREKGYNCKLLIVGKYDHNSEYFNYLQNLINNLSLKNNVLFKGVVSEEELKNLYQEADIFVFPAHNQTWGLVVFEAMASGLPVVVSNTTGASEVLTHTKNALIFNAKNYKEMADMVEMLINDPKVYEDIRFNGRKFVEENISWDKYGSKMEEIFLNLI